MNKNQFDFQKLDFTHDQINGMLKFLYRAYVDDENPGREIDFSFLTVEQLNILLEKGFENLSTFDGDYNSLANLPSFYEEIKKNMDALDIETKGHVNDLIVNMSKEYRLIAENIVNGLREEMARMNNELNEYIEDVHIELLENIELVNNELNETINNVHDELKTNIDSNHENVNNRITTIHGELTEDIHEVDVTLQESINNLNNILSESIGENRNAIQDNAEEILNLLISVEGLEERVSIVETTGETLPSLGL